MVARYFLYFLTLVFHIFPFFPFGSAERGGTEEPRGGQFPKEPGPDDAWSEFPVLQEIVRTRNPFNHTPMSDSIGAL